jgi:hypothetical protein
MTAATLMGNGSLGDRCVERSPTGDSDILPLSTFLHIERLYTFSVSLFTSYCQLGSADIEIHFLEDLHELWDIWISRKGELATHEWNVKGLTFWCFFFFVILTFFRFSVSENKKTTKNTS